MPRIGSATRGRGFDGTGVGGGNCHDIGRPIDKGPRAGWTALAAACDVGNNCVSTRIDAAGKDPGRRSGGIGGFCGVESVIWAATGHIEADCGSGNAGTRLREILGRDRVRSSNRSAGLLGSDEELLEAAGRPEINEIFLDGLKQPFGIAFYPPGNDPKYVYVANTDSVARVPYKNGETKARAKSETVVSNIPGGGRLEGGGHWTRDIVFSKDGSRMYVSVGSKSNNSDDRAEERRARIFEYSPEGKNEKVYAYGIRNAVGLAIHPDTGELWASVNERDELGDDLVPDYVTRVRENGFYGWPWFYIGANEDPKHRGKHPELKAKVNVPDVLIQAHSASLGMTFYTGNQFPADYKGIAFAAQHGSWNRARRTGYKVIYVPMNGGAATGEYVDFVTGFVTCDGNVWGRPVAVAEGKDGSLYVSDDGGNVIWRVSWADRK